MNAMQHPCRREITSCKLIGLSLFRCVIGGRLPVDPCKLPVSNVTQHDVSNFMCNGKSLTRPGHIGIIKNIIPPAGIDTESIRMLCQLRQSQCVNGISSRLIIYQTPTIMPAQRCHAHRKVAHLTINQHLPCSITSLLIIRVKIVQYNHLNARLYAFLWVILLQKQCIPKHIFPNRKIPCRYWGTDKGKRSGASPRCKYIITYA